jgi:hypothetical protein
VLQAGKSFFVVSVVDRLVIRGDDAKPPKEKRFGTNTAPVVYGAMLAQACRDYAGLPDPRSLSIGEIRWFYDWLRPELKKQTAPKNK